MISHRTAGFALLIYGSGTFTANALIAAPGGEYDPRGVAGYTSAGHSALAFVAAYLWCVASLAVLPFLLGVRSHLAGLGDLGWALSIGAATTGVVGWFVAAGVGVAMAEGGSAVRNGVPAPVVYTLTEMGNLLAWCAPALFMGVVALLLSCAEMLPRWLRRFSAVAGVSGILAPFFFTYFVFLLWALTFGSVLLARGLDRNRTTSEAVV